MTITKPNSIPAVGVEFELTLGAIDAMEMVKWAGNRRLDYWRWLQACK